MVLILTISQHKVVLGGPWEGPTRRTRAFMYTRPLNKNKILEIHIASYWFLVPPPLQCNYKPANTANYAKYGILGDYLRSLYIFHILQQGPQLGMSLSTDCADLNIVQKGDGVKPMLKKKICNGILT